MPVARPSSFALPPSLAAKSAPQLIAADEDRFARIADALADSLAHLEARLAETRLLPGGDGQAALERDDEIRRLSTRIRTLRRYTLDLCLGRMTFAGPAPQHYVGRWGLTDAEGTRLLIDWRAPAAAPFFSATAAHPAGLAARRRYRWAGGRVSDYWDEAFTADAADDLALDDDSAFVASLGAARSGRMRDVLATIQADQDAIIRAGARGALVVEGGPGTGKTVVALHRAAFLLYSDPALAPGRGGVLFVGPHRAYLSYVEDVLPGLGEESVRLCTLPDLVPEGRAAVAETDLRAAELKGSADWTAVIDRAVALYERAPVDDLTVETPRVDVVLRAEDWAEAFESAEPGATHNEARDQVWRTLVEIVGDRLTAVVGSGSARGVASRVLGQDDVLTAAFSRAWPLLDPVALVAALWSEPGLLARCAPALASDDVRVLQRDDPRAWTVADLSLLDAARSRIGDPTAGARRQRDRAVLEAQRQQREIVRDHLIAADDGDLLLMSILRGQDAENSLDDDSELEAAPVDPLAGPFAHVIVDEAQELTAAEWQMLVRRCPSRSFTVVGDRAQARGGFAEAWEERLRGVGLRDVRVGSLTVNYRTPEEVMAAAEPEIRAAVPDADVPVSVRASGIPVRRGAAAELPAIVGEWLAAHPDGTACVIGAPGVVEHPRVRSLTPVEAKGLEFDLVVVVRPDAFGPGVAGAVDRYVAMTRATERLVVLT